MKTSIDKNKLSFLLAEVLVSKIYLGQTFTKLFYVLTFFTKLFFSPIFPFLTKLHLANFIWQTFINHGLAAPILSLALPTMSQTNTVFDQTLCFYVFDQTSILFDQTSFFLSKLFFLPKQFIWRTSFGETSFGELHLAKLY